MDTTRSCAARWAASPPASPSSAAVAPDGTRVGPDGQLVPVAVARAAAGAVVAARAPAPACRVPGGRALCGERAGRGAGRSVAPLRQPPRRQVRRRRLGAGRARRAGAGRLRRGVRVRHASRTRRRATTCCSSAACSRSQRGADAAAGVPGRPLPPAGRSAVRLEGTWIAMFEQVFRLCGVQPGDACAVLSRDADPARTAAAGRTGAAAPGRAALPPGAAGHAAGSTGAGAVHRRVRRHRRPGAGGAGAGGAASSSPTARSKACSTRPSCRASWPAARAVLAISHEHPEILERCLPRADDEAPVREAMRRLKAARTDAGAVRGRHRPAHRAGRRTRRRRLGLHAQARQLLALARRAGAGVSGGRQRQRHAGARPRRRQPDVQALPARPGAAGDRGRPCRARRRRQRRRRADARLLRGLGRPRRPTRCRTWAGA